MALPNETPRQVPGKQVLRSGTSTGANHRESKRARSKTDFVSKIGDCLKEAEETSYWLELLSDEKTADGVRLVPRLRETDEHIANLGPISKSAKRS